MKEIAMLLMCGLALSDAGSVLGANDDVFRQAVFTSGQDGYRGYRIPALVISKSGTLLAFCEGRKYGLGDTGKIDILLKRSTDGGKTWSKQMRVHGEEGKPHVTIGNPCPIAERDNSRIHLLFTRNNKHLFYTKSTDDGLTWSKPRDITDILKGFDYPRVRIGTGPVHGIQMKNGRLVVPVWVSDRERHVFHKQHRQDPKKLSNQCFQSGSIYSDDNGETWKIGSLVAPDIKMLNECTVVERKDGTLLLNMRAHGAGCRATAVSEDGGETWSKPVLDKNLPCPTCQGSIRRLSDEEILFLNPTGGGRTHMTLRLSEDEGKTWKYTRKINHEHAAYSDMAVSEDGTVYCLFEGGPKHRYQYLYLVRATRGWLTSDGKEQAP